MINEKIFFETGAIRKGHFVLASGLHSKFYFQAQRLFQHPEIASSIGRETAKIWKDGKIDGKWIDWDMNGEKETEEIYKDGKLVEMIYCKW